MLLVPQNGVPQARSVFYEQRRGAPGSTGSNGRSYDSMKRSFIIRFLDQSLTVEAPDSIAGDIAAFFGLASEGDAGSAVHNAVVSEETPGRYELAYDGKPLAADCSRGALLHRLNDLAGRELSFARRGIPLMAAAVGWEGKTVLIIGPPGSGKSHIAAWLIENGFSYVADSEISLLDDDGTLAGFPGPLSFPEHPISHVAAMPTFRNLASVAGGSKRLLIRPEPAWQASDVAQPCGLIVLAHFTMGAALRIEPVPKDEAPFRVLEATSKVILPSDPEYPTVAGLAESVPILRLTYGGFAQIEGVLDFLIRATLADDSTPAAFERFLAGLPRAAETAAKTYPVPARTERTLTSKPKLTIGMPTYDDFDGVYFSIQAIRMYHPEIVDDVEFVVVDNHPDGVCAAQLKQLEDEIPNYRYVPLVEPIGSAAAKNRVLAEAYGTFVLCMDCHVFIVPGALRRLLDYCDANPQTSDLLQGPMISESLARISTHFEPEWRGGMYGVWAQDPAGDDPDGPPFDIPIQGTGLFACRRDAWPGFDPLFRGFGGEEGYIHEKVRRAGGRTLCLPFLRWLHRFRRPLGQPYRNTWEDRCWNYMVGWRELGLPTDALEAHFTELLGDEPSTRIFAAVKAELDGD